jgi:thiopurine S-methyltransferase
MELDQHFWEQQYLNKRTAWDIGYPSPPIIEYVDQLKDKTLKILIPGAGNAWEVEYLWKKGFVNVYLLDFSKTAIQQFKS